MAKTKKYLAKQRNEKFKREKKVKWPPKTKFGKSMAWLNFRKKYLEDKKNFEGYYLCAVCGRWRETIEIDHIVPRSQAPSRVFDESNLQLLCHSCHFSKTNRDLAWTTNASSKQVLT